MEDGSTRELHINKLRAYISTVDPVGAIFDQDSDFVTADSLPKRLQPYRVPIALQKEVERQVNELLDMDLIEHSDSDWAQPVVCVAKRDGMKGLTFWNEECGQNISKIYGPMSPHHNYCRSYIDDVAVFSETSSGHMQHLEGVFKTLREVGLTVNLENRPSDAPLAPEEYVEKLQARMEEIHHLARERIGMASEKLKTRYDARATGHDFHEGDKVWLWNPKRLKGLSPKLQTNWEGPYIVLKRLTDVVVRIQKSPHSKPKVIHYNMLAPYLGQDE
ncbi:integrase core domain protein [Trichonephila clavipes]|nr:integrase core domain protein [Trichonephila clavipes]